MNNKITEEMVEKGFKDGLIKLISNSSDNIGTVCKIGDYWFYFDDKAEDMTPKEYTDNTPTKEIINNIYDTLESFRVDDFHDFRDEYLYYYYFLKENL